MDSSTLSRAEQDRAIQEFRSARRSGSRNGGAHTLVDALTLEALERAHPRGWASEKSAGSLGTSTDNSGEELVMFVGGVALVGLGSLALSSLLGFAGQLFEHLEMRDLGGALVTLGEKGAGALMGLAASAFSQETKSVGACVGCWTGMGLYLWWVFA